MTTLKQAATIEKRIHVHAILAEVYFTQCDLDYEAASTKARDNVSGITHKKLERIERHIMDGDVDGEKNASSVARIIKS